MRHSEAAYGTRGVVVDGKVAAHLLCGKCHYDLHGAAADDDCPECGQSVRESLARPYAPWTQAQKTVVRSFATVAVVLPVINLSCLATADFSKAILFVLVWMAVGAAFCIAYLGADFRARFASRGAFLACLFVGVAGALFAAFLNLRYWGEIVASV